ncbi:MAG: hypothetical protein ACLFV3_09570 [Phycisphaeraceae bacterium]
MSKSGFATRLARGRPARGRRSALARGLPWAVAIVVHLALVVPAGFIVWSRAVEPEPEEVVPVLRLGEQTHAALRTRAPERLELPGDEREQPEREAGETDRPPVPPEMQPLGRGLEAPETLRAPERPIREQLVSREDLEVEFMGSRGGNVRRVVFVIDASGAMVDLMPTVLEHLQRAIGQLSEWQSFAVIFFRGENLPGGGGDLESLVEPPPGGMRKASAERRAAALTWLDPDNHPVQMGGAGRPVEAVGRAMQYDPDLVFLLSDNITGRGGQRSDPRQLVARVDRLTPERTRINTIQFVYRDPLQKAGDTGTMELIARQTGGRYRFVGEEDLRRY